MANKPYKLDSLYFCVQNVGLFCIPSLRRVCHDLCENTASVPNECAMTLRKSAVERARCHTA